VVAAPPERTRAGWRLFRHGSMYRITRSSADTGGELLEMEWELPPHGWAPQPHLPSSPDRPALDFEP
jgi:hypothetical protein